MAKNQTPAFCHVLMTKKPSQDEAIANKSQLESCLGLQLT